MPLPSIRNESYVDFEKVEIIKVPAIFRKHDRILSSGHPNTNSAIFIEMIQKNTEPQWRSTDLWNSSPFLQKKAIVYTFCHNGSLPSMVIVKLSIRILWESRIANKVNMSSVKKIFSLMCVQICTKQSKNENKDSSLYKDNWLYFQL